MTDSVIPFQIAVGPRVNARAYPVRVIVEQDEVRAEITLPEQLLEQSGRGASADHAALGRQLGQLLFVPPVRELLLRAAHAADEIGARLQLQLQLAPPEVAAIQWEWLSLGSSHVWRPAIRDDYALVRVSRRSAPFEPAAVAGPLRLLLVASRSEEELVEAIELALAGEHEAGKLAVTAVRGATPEKLELALRRARPHIVHLCAPASATGRGGVRLHLGAGIEAFDLADLLADEPDLRLVTLSGPARAADPAGALPALATTLLGEVVPATIALGGLGPRAAAGFAGECYRQIAAGEPVDLAVTAGRRALADEERGWGLPQLRLTPGTGQLFVFRSAARGRISVPALVARRSAAPAAEPIEAQPAPARRSQVRALPPTGPRAYGRPERVRRGTDADSARSGQRPAARGGLMLAALGVACLVLLGLVWGRWAGAGDSPAVAAQPFTAQLRVAASNAVPTVVALPVMRGPLDLPPPERFTTYLVAEGDTFETIARRLGSDAPALAAMNYLSPREPLRAGRPLVVPIYRGGEEAPVAPLVMRGNPAKPMVALTFDVEVDDASLYAILDVLRARGVRATFFFPGSYAQIYPDAVRAAAKDGHELGNHSMTHPFFSRIGVEGAIAELRDSERILREVAGASAQPYFRFPYGDSTEQMLEVAAREGYVAYHWSADDPAIDDWLAAIAQAPSEGNGGILLMHGRMETAAALPGWLDQLAEIGLTPTTLREVMR